MFMMLLSMVVDAVQTAAQADVIWNVPGAVLHAVRDAITADVIWNRPQA